MASVLDSLGNIDYLSSVSGIMVYIKWGFYMVLLFIVLVVLYFYISYNIKATVFPMYGSGKDGVFSVQRNRWNRLRWSKKKEYWIPLLPPFNKKEIEPFDSEFIYPGNQIYAFELNDKWIPGRVNIDKTEDEVRAEINPVPYYVRNWQSLQHKKDEIEYAEKDWWNDNKTMVFALIFAAVLIAGGLIFVYITYKMAGAGRQDISALTEAIKNFGNIPGGESVPR